MIEPVKLLWAAVLEYRGDPTDLHALADALEESGDCRMAHAYHWAARWKRWPHSSPRGQSICWQRSPKQIWPIKGSMKRCYLPWPVFDCMTFEARRFGFRTTTEAFEALGHSLEYLRRMIEL